MRVLLVHSFYNIRGGEDIVFENERNLLREDNIVESFTQVNKGGVSGLWQFLCSIWNFNIAKKFDNKIKEFKPDVIHVHNWHFSMGPIIFRVAKKNNIPVVATLHNYRLLCPSATLTYNGQIFLKSLYEVFPWTAIFNRAYRRSFFLTFWLAFVVWTHKGLGTWHLVDRYILLAPFAEELFLKSNLGVKQDKFVLKPNFSTLQIPMPEIERSNKFLFVGRLTEEKGIRVLMNVFKESGYSLEIIGTGPLLKEVLAASKEHKNIHYYGILNKDETYKVMRSCSALVIPSTWYEPFGLVIIEAFSVGTPVIGSRIGAISSLVNDGHNGLHVDPRNEADLNSKIGYWLGLKEGEKELFSKNASDCYQERFTPEVSRKMLDSIYADFL